MKLLREKLPDAKVLLLGILPRQNDYFCNRIDRINALIAKATDGKMVRYLDMGQAFVQAPGKVSADLYTPDQLHLVAKGYELWKAKMQPVLDEMLK